MRDYVFGDEVLAFVDTLIFEGIENVDLLDAENVSKLLCVCSVKISAATFYELAFYANSARLNKSPTHADLCGHWEPC